MTKESANNIAFSLNLLFRFFIPSYFGDVVSHNYRELFNDVFQIEWIDAGKNDKKNFLILQEILKQSFQLTAAKIFAINLKSFLKIIESAYSMYAVLQQIKS